VLDNDVDEIQVGTWRGGDRPSLGFTVQGLRLRSWSWRSEFRVKDS
jgi:hypothetical protein